MRTLFNKHKKRVPNSLREALADCLVSHSEMGKEYVYKKYYGYVMSISLRYLGHEMEAEEITNESFVKCFNRLDRFKQHEQDESLEKTFRSWLARITVNTSIDFIRSRKDTAMLDDTSDYELMGHTVTNSQSLDVIDIMQLLDHLPEIQKTIFSLYEIDGYSHEEIGEKLGIPDGTSRTYLARAKQRLRKLYTMYFAESTDS